MEANTPLEPSSRTYSTKGSDIKRPFLTHPCRMEWQMDQPNDPGEGDGNALASQTKARILGQGIADNSLLDKLVAIESNKAQSATGAMVRQKDDL